MMCNLKCCHSMLASILCVLNTVSLILGGMITAIGIYGFVNKENYLSIMGHEYIVTSSVLVAVGALIATISFIGSCGTCTETSWMLRLYR